jgi:hypothetical protein
MPFTFKFLEGTFCLDTCHCVINNKYVIAEPENGDGYIYLILNSIGQRESFFNNFNPAWEKAVAIHTASNDADKTVLATAI